MAGDTGDQRVTLARQVFGKRRQVLRNRIDVKRDEPSRNPVAVSELARAAESAVEIIEHGDRVVPGLRGSEADLDLEHDTRRAPAVLQQLRILAAQLDDPWALLDCHHLHAEDVAPRGEDPVVDRADSAGAARIEATERGDLVRRWQHPQLPSGCQRFAIQRAQPDAGLRARDAWLQPHDLVETKQADDHAAVQRSELSVVTSPAAAH